MEHAEARDYYVSLWRQRPPHAPDLAAAPWAQAAHDQGIDCFAAQGFPTVHDEAWRFTSLRPVLESAFVPGVGSEDTGLRDLIPESFDDPRLVFVNGFYSDELSLVGKLPDGVDVRPLTLALTERSDLRARFGRCNWKDKPFAALNTAFFADGALVFVPRGVELRRAIHLVFITVGSGVMCHPRNLIILEDSAHAKVVETYLGGPGHAPNLANVVTEVQVAPNAGLTHFKLQQERADSFHIATSEASVSRAARYVSHSISFGAALCRNDLAVGLAAEGAETVLNGLYVTEAAQHVDNHTFIDHTVPHCTSNEVYKGILNDRSRGVFDGRILVRPNAQKTVAEQQNKNLLLSDDATADSKPMLEIFADDVKCAHGAAIGRLDEQAVYYLRSRGLDELDARGLLTHAFAGEMVDRLTVECVREWADAALWQRIPNGIRLRPAGEDARICLPAFGREHRE